MFHVEEESVDIYPKMFGNLPQKQSKFRWTVGNFFEASVSMRGDH